MKLAITQWNERVSPVFDVSRMLYLVTEEAAGCYSSEVKFFDGTPDERIKQLLELEIEELICGAISRPIHNLVIANGIKVHPFISGKIDDVFLAWQEKRLTDNSLSMPGCRGRGGRRFRNRRDCKFDLKKD